MISVVLASITSANAASLVWSSSFANNAWDVGITKNWLNNGAQDYFQNGASVNFTDAGSLRSPVLNTNVAPLSVSFNSIDSYTLSGTGSIIGTTGLLKTNTGALTITTSNTYTGTTYLGGGMVNVAAVANGGTASPLGAAANGSSNLVFDGGILQYTGESAATDRGATLNSGGGTVMIENASVILTLNGPITGASLAEFTKAGPGWLALGGANTYAGNTLINAGTLTFSTNPSSSGLAALYAFNGTGADTSGNGNNLTLVGSPSFVSGRLLTC